MVNTSLALTFGERVAYAGRMTLIGMMTVFSALAVLWGALALFRIALAAADKRRAAKTAVTAPAAPAAAAPAPAPTAENGEVVAAITAAISLMLAEENGGVTPRFRVVSYRRSGRKN